MKAANVGYLHGVEEELASAAVDEETTFQVVDTHNSSLSRHSAYIILGYLSIGCAFFSWSEGWPWDDALYYCVVTMTTTGYGDLVPTSNASKLFAVTYIIFGLSFGASALGLIVARFEARINKSFLTELQRKDRHWWQVATSLVTIAALVAIGACYVSWSEGWGAVDAVYWAVVSASSTGYGDLVIENETTRWFCIVYLLIAVGGFAMSLSKFSSIVMEVEAERALNEFVNRGVSMAMIEEMDVDGSGSVDRAEFLRYMLITMGKVEAEDLDKLLGIFAKLDLDGSGSIDRADILRDLGNRWACAEQGAQRGLWKESTNRAPRPAAKPTPPANADDTIGRGSALKALAKPLLP